jgi:hypothetical protein
MEICYADGADFPGQPLMLSVHCIQCGNTGWIKGLSVAAQKIRAEQNEILMARAMALKYLAIGVPDAPTDAEVEAWEKVEVLGHGEMTAEDRRKAREFLEAFPEALVEAGVREVRSESGEKRAKTKSKQRK